MSANIIRAASKYGRKPVWHYFDQTQASVLGIWHAKCGTKIRVLDLTNRVESYWGCARCNRSKPK